MDRYEHAGTDDEAWLAFRALIHIVDHRLIVESHRSGWPDALSHARAANLAIASADFERLFTRVEGDPARMFAGVAYPSGMAPWSELLLYQSGVEGAG